MALAKKNNGQCEFGAGRTIQKIVFEMAAES
jgi:hypothetical protein